MSEPSSPRGLPGWVRKRDGRVVAFDPDAISQDLFAAAESLGGADPFLARELTDGVLHFLAADMPEGIPSTEAIAETVVKVVRELRQPRLAQAFAQRPRPAPTAVPHPADLARAALRDFSLAHVYGRDLAAAHRAGLLVLTGLETPLQLAALAVSPADPARPLDWLEPLARTRQLASGWAVLDNPAPSEELTRILVVAGMPVRVHLNVAAGPASEPLFAGMTEARPTDASAFLAAGTWPPGVGVDWHVADAAFVAAPHRLVQLALDGGDVAFVFDRPRRSLSLGPGLDRRHTALLLCVGLHLPRLVQHAGAADVELYLRKLGSLARLAVSAAVQKRQFLRHWGDEQLRRGLLLERASLLVTPLGLDVAVRTFTGAGLAEGKAALDLGRRVIEQLQTALADEGRRRLVDCFLDAPPGAEFGDEQPGPTPWTFDQPAERQLAAAGKLHAVCGGTAVVGFPERPAVERVAEVLTFAWRQTEVTRLLFCVRRPTADSLRLTPEP